MKWFRNITISSKLLLVFGVLCVLLAGLSTLAYQTLAAIQKNERDNVDQIHLMALTAAEFRAHENRIRSEMLQFLASENQSDRSAIKSEIDDRAKKIQQGIALIQTYWTTQREAEGIALIATVEKQIATYRDGRTEQFNLVEAGKVKEARLLGVGLQHERFEAIRATMLKVDDILHKETDAAVAESARLFNEATRVFIGIAAGSILLAVVMAWFMNRLLAMPLRSITGIAERVAMGDLTVRIEVENRTDEIGGLQQAFQTMISSLRELNRDLREGVGVLASSSTEILATVSQVATGAAETATAVSQTSTTAEEVKQTAHLSHQKAKNVQESAQRTATVSEAGHQAVAKTIEGMHHIREQMESIAESVVRLSEQGQAISEIIATVNDLAEQSNLLAVNAALEASRAGEYGKEFAVVAQEVKSLAEQSRQATAQVRVILMEVQKATSAAVMATEQGTKVVAAGVKQATDAGDSIRALAGSIGDAAQAATQIAASNQQQLIGMDQIASAIANIRQATSQNLAGTQQLKTSAQSLQAFGERLKGLVERQRLEN
ncbi:methyl-accepting chemotaxis protein [Gammaproteobacteria bacterium]